MNVSQEQAIQIVIELLFLSFYLELNLLRKRDYGRYRYFPIFKFTRWFSLKCPIFLIWFWKGKLGHFEEKSHELFLIREKHRKWLCSILRHFKENANVVTWQNPLSHAFRVISWYLPYYGFWLLTIMNSVFEFLGLSKSIRCISRFLFLLRHLWYTLFQVLFLWRLNAKNNVYSCVAFWKISAKRLYSQILSRMANFPQGNFKA